MSESTQAAIRPAPSIAFSSLLVGFFHPSSNRDWRAMGAYSAFIEDQTSVLSTGDKHVVAVAPQVPIGHIAHPTGRAPTESVR